MHKLTRYARALVKVSVYVTGTLFVLSVAAFVRQQWIGRTAGATVGAGYGFGAVFLLYLCTALAGLFLLLLGCDGLLRLFAGRSGGMEKNRSGETSFVPARDGTELPAVIETGGKEPVDVLLSWCREREEQLTSAGVEIRYVRTPNQDPQHLGAFVDFDSEIRIGRVTVWNAGYCDAEILDVETGEQVLWRHYDRCHGDQLRGVLNEFAGRFISAS